MQDNAREGRIECAIEALQRNKIPNIRRAASTYRVNYETLRCCLQGRPARAEAVANNRKLDDDEENTLHEWMLTSPPVYTSSQAYG